MADLDTYPFGHEAGYVESLDGPMMHCNLCGLFPEHWAAHPCTEEERQVWKDIKDRIWAELKG